MEEGRKVGPHVNTRFHREFEYVSFTIIKGLLLCIGVSRNIYNEEYLSHPRTTACP